MVVRGRWVVVAVAVVAAALVGVRVEPAAATVSYADTVLGRDPALYFRLGDSAPASSSTELVEETGGSVDSQWLNAMGDPGATPPRAPQVSFGLSHSGFGGNNAVSFADRVGSEQLGGGARLSTEEFRTPSVSYELWVKPSSLPASGQEANLLAVDGCCWDYSVPGLRLALTSSGTVVAEAGNDVPALKRPRVESRVTVSDGSWHHVVGVYEAESKSLWVVVDGTARGVSVPWFSGLAWKSASGSYRPLEVGVRTTSFTFWYNQQYVGAADELALYDRAVSLKEIREDYLASGSPAPSGWNVPVTGAGGGDSEILGPNAAKSWDDLIRCRCADPVDTGSGNLHMPIAAVSVPGRGPGLDVEMAYNSLAAANPSSIGFGWSTTLDMYLENDPFWGGKTVHQETGATVPFLADGSGGWDAPPRFTATLEPVSGGGWLFTRNHTERFGFDSAGRLSSMSDQYGNTTTVAYPTNDPANESFRRASTLTDSAGRSLTLAWNSSTATAGSEGKLASITEPALTYPTSSGRQAAFTYDSNGNLRTYTDVAGGVTTFGWSGSTHLMYSMQKPRNNSLAVVEMRYDDQGRVTWQEDEMNRRTDFAYDTPAAGQTTVTMPAYDDAGDRHVRIDTYVDGRRTRTVTAAGTGAQQTTDFTFDDDTDAPETITDNAGKVTSFTSDANGNLTSRTDPTGRTTRYVNNGPFDQVTSVKVGERNGNTSEVVETVNEYDSTNGRLEKTTVAAGTGDEAITDFHYGDSAHPGDVTSVTDPRGKLWQSGYNAATGYLEWSQNPEGERTAYSYNEIGWPKTITSPRGTATVSPTNDFQTSYSYNLAERSTTVTGPTGDQTKTVLDANGNVSSVASGATLSDVTSYGYDTADELTAVTLPGGAQKLYDYYANGAQKSFRNELSATTSYTYDANGNVLTETDPLTRVTTNTYDPVGRVKTTQQTGGDCTASPKTGCITYFYDDAGRITGIDYSDAATADLVGAGGDYSAGVTYDRLGRRTSARSQDSTSSWTETWTWSKRSQINSHTDRNGDTTSYEYNADGTNKKITYPGSKVVDRGFDNAGRLTSTTDWASRTATFGYDDDSNWDSTTFGTANSDVFGYDAAGRMTSATWKQGTTTLGSETYTRPTSTKGMVDATTPTGAAGTAARDNGYDNRDRLTGTGSGGESFTLDAASNLTKGPGGNYQAFDAAQQLCWTSASASSNPCSTAPVGATTYAYDNLGRRTGTQPAQGSGSAFSYDQANRLTAATVPSEESGDGQLVTFGVSRMLDTRSTTGGVCNPSACSRLAASTAKTFTLAGQGPIPSSGVSAVWATVTVINPSAAGNLKVNGGATAAAVTLNYESGVNRNATAIVPLVDGRITLEATTAVDVVLDVTGYFKTAGAPTDTYKASAPTRLVDTRNGTGTCSGSPCALTAANATTQVTAAGQAGIPANGAHAAVISLTAITPAASGQMKVALGWGGGGAATINYTAGETLNETVIAPIDANGKIAITTSTAIHFVIDVSGYFTAPAPTALGLGYHTITPARLVTVASGSSSGPCVGASCGPLVASTRQKIQVAGNGGVPASASAVVGYLTLSAPTADGFVRLNPNFTTGMGLAGDETVNMNNGDVRNSLVLIPLKSDGSMEIVSSVAVSGWSLDVSGYLTQPTGTTTYAYGIDGIRTKKTNPQGVATTFTYSDGSGLPLLVRQQTGTDTTYLIYGPGGQPIEQVNPDGTAIWLHHDQLGSVRLATKASDGTTQSTRRFNAYGTTANQTVTTTGDKQPLLGYAGQYTDTETGFQYLRARYYDPVTGQFLSSDPISRITLEAFGYASSNPSTHSDPSGLFPSPGEILDYLSGDWCSALARDINDLVDELRKRFDDQVENKSNSVLGGKIDIGHFKQFREKQSRLDKKIKDYKDAGCGCGEGGSSEAYDALGWEFPKPGGGERPADYLDPYDNPGPINGVGDPPQPEHHPWWWPYLIT